MRPYEDEIKRMQNEMDRMMNSVFGVGIEQKTNQTNIVPKARLPVSDILETESGYIMSIELPGVNKADIDVTLTENFIEIKVEKKSEREQKQEGYHLHESRGHSFYRKLPFPSAIDVNKATAEYVNGRLRIEACRQNTSGSRRLSIK